MSGEVTVASKSEELLKRLNDGGPARGLRQWNGRPEVTRANRMTGIVKPHGVLSSFVECVCPILSSHFYHRGCLRADSLLLSAGFRVVFFSSPTFSLCGEYPLLLSARFPLASCSVLWVAL